MQQVLPSMVYKGIPKRQTIPEPCLIPEAPDDPHEYELHTQTTLVNTASNGTECVTKRDAYQSPRLIQEAPAQCNIPDIAPQQTPTEDAQSKNTTNTEENPSKADDECNGGRLASAVTKQPPKSDKSDAGKPGQSRTQMMTCADSSNDKPQLKRSPTLVMTSNIPRGAIEPSPTDVDPGGAEFIKYCESLKGVRCTISDFITSMDEDNDGTCTTYYENLVANMSQSPSQTDSLSDDTLSPTLLLKLEATADTSNSNLTDTQATPGWTAVINLWMRQGGQPLTDADKTLTSTPGQDNPETLKKTTSPSIERLIYVDSPSFPSTGWKTPAEYIKEVCEGTGN